MGSHNPPSFAGRRASKDTEPRKGWTPDGVPARTLGAEGRWIVRSHINWREERVPARTLDLKGGWIVRSHINWREERVPTRTLDLKGGWIVRSHIGGRGEQSIFYKGVETSP